MSLNRKQHQQQAAALAVGGAEIEGSISQWFGGRSFQWLSVQHLAVARAHACIHTPKRFLLKNQSRLPSPPKKTTDVTAVTLPTYEALGWRE